MIEAAAEDVGEKAELLERDEFQLRQGLQGFFATACREEKIRNGLVAVESHFLRSLIGRRAEPGSFGKIATLLVKKTKKEPRKWREPRLNEEQAATRNEDARGFAEKVHRCSKMMEHVQAKNIGDAGGAKRETLRVDDGVEPGAEDEVGRENFGRELFEETGASAHLDGNASWFPMLKQAREEFFAVNATQNGLCFPDAAMAKKLFLCLGVDGHSDCFDCTEFARGAALEVADISGRVIQRRMTVSLRMLSGIEHRSGGKALRVKPMPDPFSNMQPVTDSLLDFLRFG